MASYRLIDILRSPSALLAILGLALLTIAREAHRYPVLLSVDNVGFITFDVQGATIQLSTLITLAGLLIACCCLAFSSHRPRLFSPGAGIIFAAFITLGYFGKFDVLGAAETSVFLRACSELTQVCGMYLLIIWAVTLYHNEHERVLALVGCSFFLSGILQGLLALALPVTGIVLCTFAPLFSILMLYLYRFSFRAHGPIFTVSQTDTEIPPEKGNGTRAFLHTKGVIYLLVGVCCYGIICYLQHQSWVGVQQSAGTAVLIQGFSALGTIVAAIILLALLKRGITTTLAYKVFAFMMLAVAALLGLFAQSNSVIPFFTAFIDAGYKIILFLMWMIPLTHKRGSEGSVFAALQATYQIGVVIASFATASAQLEFGLTVAILILMMADIVMGTFRTFSQARTHQPAAVEQREAEEAAAQDEADTREQLAMYRRLLLSMFIAEQFHLTQREFEILPYFMKGTSSKDIAHSLYISQDTVRTHRRNIYQKLGVSSHDELVARVQQVQNQDFPAFLRGLEQQDAANAELTQA